MLFNSLDFAIFLPVVFALYWLIRGLKGQNALLLVSSYLFYGWWDYRFLALILLSTAIDYVISNAIHGHVKQHSRKLLVGLSIAANIGMLGFFKYYNFFIDNFQDAFSLLGEPVTLRYMDIILPVGISFYTFQTLSYTIDVYRKHLEPAKDFIAFAAFVSFFPQLVAGPIERGQRFLPQFFAYRTFSYPMAVDGLRQMLWGFFKKMAIADNCAVYANAVFDNPDAHSGSTLAFGAVLFAFQIYGDFSGYSDIAIGTARLFGFNLMQNFAFPYFSRDIAEFWRRWHISLSTWFRDYVYIPLGGNRGGRWKITRNVFIIFLVSGFWHGANWTFIVWGLLHALFFIPLLWTNRHKKYTDTPGIGRALPSVREVTAMLGTFLLTTLAWVFFRAASVGDALNYIDGIFDPSLLSMPVVVDPAVALLTVLLICFMTVVEWIGRTGNHGLEHLGLQWPRPLRWTMYAVVIFITGLYMQTDETPFIYFQF